MLRTHQYIPCLIKTVKKQYVLVLSSVVLKTLLTQCNSLSFWQFHFLKSMHGVHLQLINRLSTIFFSVPIPTHTFVRLSDYIDCRSFPCCAEFKTKVKEPFHMASPYEYINAHEYVQKNSTLASVLDTGDGCQCGDDSSEQLTHTLPTILLPRPRPGFLFPVQTQSRDQMEQTMVTTTTIATSAPRY